MQNNQIRGEGMTEARPVQSRNGDGVIKDYRSIGAAIAATGVSNVRTACTGQHQLAGRRQWRYADGPPFNSWPTNKGVLKNRKQREVTATDIRTGKVKVYPSVAAAVREHGLLISKTVNGRARQAYGKTWEYKP